MFLQNSSNILNIFFRLLDSLSVFFLLRTMPYYIKLCHYLSLLKIYKE